MRSFGWFPIPIVLGVECWMWFRNWRRNTVSLTRRRKSTIKICYDFIKWDGKWKRCPECWERFNWMFNLIIFQFGKICYVFSNILFRLCLNINFPWSKRKHISMGMFSHDLCQWLVHYILLLFHIFRMYIGAGNLRSVRLYSFANKTHIFILFTQKLNFVHKSNYKQRHTWTLVHLIFMFATFGSAILKPHLELTKLKT